MADFRLDWDATLRFSSSDVENCLQNAKRLLRDAGKRVSEPTKVALAEIAIEELGKGFTLLFRYWLHEYGGGPNWLTRAAASAREASDVLLGPERGGELHRTLLASVPSFVSPTNRELFRSHPLKIEEFATFIRAIFPLSAALEDNPRLFREQASRLGVSESWRLRIPFVMWAFRRMMRRLEKGGAAQLGPGLKLAKEAALYVDLDPSGSRTVGPGEGPLLSSSYLLELATIGRIGLEHMLGLGPSNLPFLPTARS